MKIVVRFKSGEKLPIDNVVSITSTSQDGSRTFKVEKLPEIVLNGCSTCSLFTPNGYFIFSISEILYLQVLPS
ncbi:hypothetical protein [Selenomonas sp. AE3005]|uniref:hypothetical protein n=1 Tax=Selenomonas sp. AE3005 TaxID=1485543 RepID=UPI0025D8F26B|nr:hypothetical protein [Selenomonas sp. AE3005]